MWKGFRLTLHHISWQIWQVSNTSDRFVIVDIAMVGTFNGHYSDPEEYLNNIVRTMISSTSDARVYIIFSFEDRFKSTQSVFII